MSVTIKWEERWECEHVFDSLSEAIEFANGQLEEEDQLPDDASEEQVIDTLGELDLSDALAEIDIEERTDMQVYRDDIEVS